MKKYFLHDGVTQQGPFTFEELRAKNITPKTQVWFDPMPAWKPAGEVDELKSLFNNSSAANPVASAPATNVDWNNKQFYYMDSAGTRQGPFYLNQLAGKNITPNTSVWYEPLPSWTTAGKVEGLKNIIAGTATTVVHPVASAPVKEEDWKYKQYYYVDSAGVQQGPFHLNQLEGKGITPNTAVWYDPLPSWTTAGKVEGLKNILNSPQTVSHPAASPVREVDWNNKQFYFVDSAGVQQGPFHLNQLAGKNINPNTAVWYESLTEWTTAGKVDALKNIIAAAPTTVVHTPATSHVKEEDWNNKQYFIADSTGAQQGPFTLEQLKGKNVSPATLIWYSPLPKWTTAGEVAALKDIINTPPPIS